MELKCFIDGTSLCIVNKDFDILKNDIQESPTVFIELDGQQIEEINKLIEVSKRVMKPPVTVSTTLEEAVFKREIEKKALSENFENFGSHIGPKPGSTIILPPKPPIPKEPPTPKGIKSFYNIKNMISWDYILQLQTEENGPIVLTPDFIKATTELLNSER